LQIRCKGSENIGYMQGKSEKSDKKSKKQHAAVTTSRE
jgi:hypothetical protein